MEDHLTIKLANCNDTGKDLIMEQLTNYRGHSTKARQRIQIQGSGIHKISGKIKEKQSSKQTI